MKPTQKKPTKPITRARTRVATKQVKEVGKPKGKGTIAIAEPSQSKKKKRRKCVTLAESDEEKTYLDDMS